MMISVGTLISLIFFWLICHYKNRFCDSLPTYSSLVKVLLVLVADNMRLKPIPLKPIRKRDKRLN